MTKNTRLFYTDEAHIKMYEALPPEEFKELFMTMLKYKYGQDEIIDTISNPVIKALFISEKTHIDYNEEKWEKRAKTAKENGAKSSGRPKKTTQEPEPEIEVSTYTPTEEEMPATLIPEESPKPATTEHDEWLIALRDDNGRFSSNRQTTFNKYWQNFYEDREEALQDVRYYLKNNKVHASLA